MSGTKPERGPRESRLADALAEFLDREAKGERVEIDAFCLAYGDLQPELGEQLRTMAGIADTVSADRPDRLSGHKILDEIGAGGMGRVFLAMDEGLGRRVAIKTLASRFLTDPQLKTRFMQEARSMAGLSHPHIVHIYNLGQPTEAPHFVMEYVDGVPLTQACGPLTLRQKVEMFHKIVLAVDFLHRNGIIHRDLKPGNVLVGADLEPKLLDFGLALHLKDGNRFTRTGVLVGTPRYFSPEQAVGDSALDARSDVFSLGTIFYELLTGVLPFRASSHEEELQIICEQDPVLPRRINAAIPGELQNICLKALEKLPRDRYGSAREMAEDLARYLAGEAPLAMPTSYARLTSGKIDRHLKELEAWKQDELLSDEEYRAFRTSYGRLIDREDAWIMEARRLTVSQVSLYLGAWLTVIGAALLVLFNYADLQGALKVGVAVAATVPMAWLGIRWWEKRLLRVGMAFLLAFCLLMPITLLVGMGEFNILAQVPDENLELLSEEFLPEGYRAIRNAQLFWAILLSLPVYLWLRRFTRSSVFMFSTAIAGALLAIVTLLRMGLLQWIMDERYTYAYFQLIPVALIFFAIGIAIEKWGYSEDSRPFYPIAVAFTWIGLSGMAYTHQGYLDFVGDDSEYLYLINAGIYFVLQSLCEALPWSRLQSMGRAFRLVIPGHVLVSIWSLGNHAMNQWKGPEGEVLDLAYRFEARFFEVLLPCLACAFVYLSIPRQMKNFFVWGMVFLAIGVVNLQNDIFANRRGWLICLMLGGLAIMFLSTHYSDLRLVLSRRFSSHRKK